MKMITDKQDKVLGVVGVLLPVVFAFLIGAILTAKLFNPQVSFSLLDYTIIGCGVFTIFFGIKEQLNSQ